MPTLKLILRRIAYAIVIVFVLTVIAFFTVRKQINEWVKSQLHEVSIDGAAAPQPTGTKGASPAANPPEE